MKEIEKERTICLDLSEDGNDDQGDRDSESESSNYSTVESDGDESDESGENRRNYRIDPRRSEREPRPLRHAEYVYSCEVQPTTYKEFLRCKEQHQWQVAMEKELLSLNEYET